MSRKKNPRQAPPRTRKKRTVPVLLGIIALLIVGATAYTYVDAWRATRPMAEYAPDDIVYRQPIRAIHEMGPGPRIQFLPENQPQPEIVVPEGVYDFGTIGPKDVVTYSFAIRNAGEAPLSIVRAFTTCGCTTAEITARVIPPGKAAMVKLRFDAGFHETRGQTVKRGLIIENNDRRQSKAEVWTVASVRIN